MSIPRYFEFNHLPPELGAVSGEFFSIACRLDALLKDGEEKQMMFRKLLEAKDCAVRAALPEKA